MSKRINTRELDEMTTGEAKRNALGRFSKSDNADSARRFLKMVRRERPGRVQGQKVSAAELQVLFKSAAYLLDTSENIDADLSPLFT